MAEEAAATLPVLVERVCRLERDCDEVDKRLHTIEPLVGTVEYMADGIRDIKKELEKLRKRLFIGMAVCGCVGALVGERIWALIFKL